MGWMAAHLDTGHGAAGWIIGWVELEPAGGITVGMLATVAMVVGFRFANGHQVTAGSADLDIVGRNADGLVSGITIRQIEVCEGGTMLVGGDDDSRGQGAGERRG
ncbi:hypothetical protein M0220_11950 [Halomonas qinghailakensis]|uniref:Uncharacterized protein n=3 Tax=Halomonas TaxID=2745 RepID=A0AA46TNF6_9GAMM|nr:MULTISPECIES: hypothetical protein [Halomonas]UYO73591.1 hypothetical protein M0220_11950 [Halomonas sp. ZZQ-149]UYV18328.1 hypothetical protein K1Y77_12660 [Halomonas qaidamensis]